MQCMHPSLIKNPAWDGTKDSIQSFQVPCGRCIGCRIARTREWSIRCLHELEYYDDAVFITLTYDDDNLPMDGGLHKDHLQRFFKRVRKELGKKSIKYFACGEYGDTTFRPHYHAIIFGLSPVDRGVLDRNWRYGFNTIGSVTYDSIKYVCGYVQKKLYGKDAAIYGEKEKPFCLNSQGIGKRYVIDHEAELRSKLSVSVRGVDLSLPRYYRKVLGIDTADFFESTSDYREELEQIFQSRVPDDVPVFVRKNMVLHERQKSLIQYGKNMEARLSLKERDKC